jgi:hypothetical protein
MEMRLDAVRIGERMRDGWPVEGPDSGIGRERTAAFPNPESRFSTAEWLVIPNAESRGRQAPNYIAAINRSANSEHFTSVAPGMRRAKS